MSLMMVRGGEPGQNQYLLDNVPLIYVNHFGGLLSVFNPDMINSVDFYKGNFPARQGGKLSSIVDITQREGNISKHQGSFSLGVTDVSFSFEGPLSKNITYIVTARKTFLEALLAGITTISGGNSNIGAYGFHDMNAKITWKPSDANHFSLNFYQGDDYLNFWSKPWEHKSYRNHVYNVWGNWLLSARWNRVVNSRMYGENILSYSRYRNLFGLKYLYKEEGEKKKTVSKNRSSVENLSFRSMWKYSISRNWNVGFGGESGFLTYQPDYIYRSTSATPAIGNIYHALESAIYIDNQISVWRRLRLQPSFRLTHFLYSSKSFFEPEPRLNISYNFSENQSVNLNFTRVTQSAHLVFTNTNVLKREVWLPATNNLPPEISKQFAASWNGSFAGGTFSVETSFYFKRMTNLVTLKEGYENMMDIVGIENKVEGNGIGKAYGAELTLSKNTGTCTGSVSYGWSYSDRKFSNINNGIPYEFDYNRPHNLVLNLSKELKKNWDVNLVWIWQSGNPITPALAKYYTQDMTTGTPRIAFVYGTKNSSRVKPYHRLDIGFNHNIVTKKGYRAVWTYSVYNLYNNINPFDYYYDNDKDFSTEPEFDKPLKLYKIGLFSIIPSISYKVYFDYNKETPKKEKEKKKKEKFHWLYF